MILRQQFSVTLDMNTIWFGYHRHERKLNIYELNTLNNDIPNGTLDSKNYMTCTMVLKFDKNVRAQRVLNRIWSTLNLHNNHTDDFKNYRTVTNVDRNGNSTLYFILSSNTRSQS